MLVIALALAIISASYDEITQVNFSMLGQHTTYYCGWQELHSSDDSFFDQNSNDDNTYKQNCDKSYGHSSCHMEKVGNAWLSLVVIGILFGIVSIAGFVLDVCISCHCFAFGGALILGICMLAAIIQWSVEEKCTTTCQNLNYVCHSEWGISLILGTISGAVAILSCVTYGMWD